MDLHWFWRSSPLISEACTSKTTLSEVKSRLDFRSILDCLGLITLGISIENPTQLCLSADPLI